MTEPNQLNEREFPDLSETEKEQTVLEQMGGISGLIYSTLPVLVLIPVNTFYGLAPALWSALGAAFLILIWRLVRRKTVVPAISAFFGVAICALIAWLMGEAKGYFLYGIVVSAVFALVSVWSVFLRWPLVGVVWKSLNNQGTQWRQNPLVVRFYTWATLVWAVVFAARFCVQFAFYNADETNALAIARLIMGWPLTGVAVIFTFFMIRRASAVLKLEKVEEEVDGNV